MLADTTEPYLDTLQVNPQANSFFVRYCLINSGDTSRSNDELERERNWARLARKQQ